MYDSAWKTVTLDFDRSSTEFVGDDVDRFSELCDLGSVYEKIVVIIPPLSTSGAVSIYGQNLPAIATVCFQVQAWDTDATGHYAHATSSGAGSIIAIFNVGGLQYFRVNVDANQSANRVFYCKGVRS